MDTAAAAQQEHFLLLLFHLLKPEPKHAVLLGYSSRVLTTGLSSVRDYERSAPVGMMHMNRSHISELGVRKRGNYSNSAF